MSRISLLVGWLFLAGCGAGVQAPGSSPAVGGEVARQEGARLFEAGRQAAWRGDGVRAEQYLASAIERGFPKERALPLLLKVCLAGSHLRAALDHAQPYLQEHPDQDALRFLVASIHVGLDQQDQAMGELDLLLKRNPHFHEAIFLRAMLLIPSDAEGARAGFRDYLDVAPSGNHAAEARSHLSELALREARAEATATQTVEVKP